MEVLSFVGGSLLSATFDFLLQKLNGYISDQLWNSKEEVCTNIESWRTLLPKITTILQHAEENQVANQFEKSCLDDLRNLAYDMEDLLEEFVIYAKWSKSTTNPEASTSKGQKDNSSDKKLLRSQANSDGEINCLLNDITSRLQRIENEMHTLGLINSTIEDKKKSHVMAKRLLESSLLEDKARGRDSDKYAIIQSLLKDGGSLEQDFVIPIVGMGGLGKTTLARLIYNDEELKGKFDLKAWVCVSDEFDVARITRTILECVTKERCDFDFGLLQEKLREKLSGLKFFLVLDDVWNKEYSQWDVLKRPFMSGAPGSKIIVTTRNKDVGTMMRGDDGVYNLELLQDDACLPLFTQHALGKENFDAHPDLQDVGEKLVKRCKRLPLALKTLGGVLRGKLHRDEWENILNNKIWCSSEDRSGILSTLRLSYNHLPSHLKRCFAYCALFPKDYEFDENKLVLLWMAEGLLQQQSHEKKQMEEEIGHQYFRELLSRSLFQQSSGVESRFVMHDLINDLAVDVAGEIYCNLEHSMGDGKLEKARHLSFIPHDYEISERFKILDKLKHLRTFLPLRVHHSFLSNRILHDFLATSHRLRVLSLCGYEISKLPDSLEKLKHIRYIDLSGTCIQCIPQSVDSLLFLQTLLLSDCKELTRLPTTIWKLIDLHHLDITNTESLKEMPSGIRHLKNLVTLSKVVVGTANGLMKLYDLRNLLQLQGRLSILDLQNVSNVDDAIKANLDKIHGLEELVLKWTTFDSEQDELDFKIQILNCLKPHSNLKSLEISCYGGNSFPNWVCDPSLFLNLSSMKLISCKKCTLLPSLGQLPVLKKLIIEGMEAIKSVGLEFYGGHDFFRLLEELVFQNMLNWKEWTSPIRSEGEFPCLHRLVIQNCPKLLGQLPSNLSSLKELDVRNCKAMILKSMNDLTSLAISMSLPSLKELYIENCNGVLLKSMVDLTSLIKLRIEKISELTYLPKSFTQSLTTLETLYIGNCNDLAYLWEEEAERKQRPLPFNLKNLSLVRCGALKSLPDAMMMRSGSNTSMLMLRLEKLEIDGCDSLKSFPRGKLPISLKYLGIKSCGGLKSLPEADGDNNNSNLHLEIMNVPCLYSFDFVGCHQLPTFLKEFTVANSDKWLESFLERMLQRGTRLQSIDIINCESLKSLPTLDCINNLLKLTIYKCRALESLPEELGLCTPKLKCLGIEQCENLKFLPNTVYQLKSLQELCMLSCPNIKFIPNGLKLCTPNLKKFEIEDCKNLKCVPNTMSQLASLEFLSIPGGDLIMGLQNLTSLQYLTIQHELPLNIVLPSSLTSLGIFNAKDLKSIPAELFQNLSSLQDLQIVNCLKLKSLPSEAFPRSLGRLCIQGSRHLKQSALGRKETIELLPISSPTLR